MHARSSRSDCGAFRVSICRLNFCRCRENAGILINISARMGGQESEIHVKKRMLLFMSSGAMFLSVALLVTPSSASLFPHRCSFCSNATKTATCEPLTADSCSCPLPPPLKTNTCF